MIALLWKQEGKGAVYLTTKLKWFRFFAFTCGMTSLVWVSKSSIVNVVNTENSLFGQQYHCQSRSQHYYHSDRDDNNRNNNNDNDNNTGLMLMYWHWDQRSTAELTHPLLRRWTNGVLNLSMCATLLEWLYTLCIWCKHIVYVLCSTDRVCRGVMIGTAAYNSIPWRLPTARNVI